MNALLARVRSLLGGLSPRERTLVMVFAALLVVAVVWEVAVDPLTAGRARLAADIEARRSELGTVRELAARVRALEAAGPAEDSVRMASADFSLFAFMDKAAGSAIARERVAAMTPNRRALDGGGSENTVEVKLTAVTLAELVELLRSIESAKEPVFVKRMDMRRRYDDEGAFDVTLLASALAAL